MDTAIENRLIELGSMGDKAALEAWLRLWLRGGARQTERVLNTPACVSSMAQSHEGPLGVMARAFLGITDIEREMDRPTSGGPLRGRLLWALRIMVGRWLRGEGGVTYYEGAGAEDFAVVRSWWARYSNYAGGGNPHPHNPGMWGADIRRESALGCLTAPTRAYMQAVAERLEVGAALWVPAAQRWLGIDEISASQTTLQERATKSLEVSVPHDLDPNGTPMAWRKWARHTVGVSISAIPSFVPGHPMDPDPYESLKTATGTAGIMFMVGITGPEKGRRTMIFAQGGVASHNGTWRVVREADLIETPPEHRGTNPVEAVRYFGGIAGEVIDTRTTRGHGLERQTDQ